MARVPTRQAVVLRTQKQYFVLIDWVRYLACNQVKAECSHLLLAEQHHMETAWLHLTHAEQFLFIFELSNQVLHMCGIGWCMCVPMHTCLHACHDASS